MQNKIIILLCILLSNALLTLSPSTTSAFNLVKLNVPYHRQEHSLSCEIASLKMALGTVAANVSENELISKLYFDPTPKSLHKWGDPHIGFVGKIDGKMLQTGYGVYWEPIARLGLQYRRTEILHNAVLQDITYHLHEGRPVIVWGYYGEGEVTTWQTPAGRTISGVRSEHARVVVGYTGEQSNPDSFILYDPIFGELHWSWEEFWKNWSALERGGVAVYPHPKWIKEHNDPTVWEIHKDGKTRHGIAMDWEQFLSYGGLPEAIVSVGQVDVEQFQIGSDIR